MYIYNRNKALISLRPKQINITSKEVNAFFFIYVF